MNDAQEYQLKWNQCGFHQKLYKELMPVTLLLIDHCEWFWFLKKHCLGEPQNNCLKGYHGGEGRCAAMVWSDLYFVRTPLPPPSIQSSVLIVKCHNLPKSISGHKLIKKLEVTVCSSVAICANGYWWWCFHYIERWKRRLAAAAHKTSMSQPRPFNWCLIASCFHCLRDMLLIILWQINEPCRLDAKASIYVNNWWKMRCRETGIIARKLIARAIHPR